MIILKVRSDAVTGLLDGVGVAGAAITIAIVAGYGYAFWKPSMSLSCNSSAGGIFRYHLILGIYILISSIGWMPGVSQRCECSPVAVPVLPRFSKVFQGLTGLTRFRG
jgi:hypothetical protein